MSENKYIIDKDSLTGIANAVRDKLGTGEATIDETTGEIIYPEGKGYYVESVDYIAVSDFQNSFNNGTYSKYIVRFYTSDYSEKVEKPFSQIEMEGYIYWYSLTPTLKINENSFSLENDSTTPQKITKVFDTPQSYLSVEFSIYNKYARAQLFYFKDIKILLKDENGVPIKLVSSGFPANYGSPPTTCTIETVPGVKKPIPYSVADIKNNIKDYWNVPSGVSIPVPLQTHMNWGSSATTDYSSFWYDFDCTNISSLTFKYKALLPYNSNTGVKAKDLKFNLDVYYGSKIWHKSGSNERAGVTAVDNASLCSTEHEIVDFDFPNETAAGEGVYTTGDYSHTINVPNNTWITLNIKLSYGSNSYHKIGQLILYDFSVVPREA